MNVVHCMQLSLSVCCCVKCDCQLLNVQDLYKTTRLIPSFVLNITVFALLSWLSHFVVVCEIFLKYQSTLCYVQREYSRAHQAAPRRHIYSDAMRQHLFNVERGITESRFCNDFNNTIHRRGGILTCAAGDSVRSQTIKLRSVVVFCELRFHRWVCVLCMTNNPCMANNPYVVRFDPNLPTTYITYLDVNSLYGKAQSEPLPVSGFQFLDESELKDFDVMSISADSEHSYIVECDLTYPPHIHDAHSDYPLAPEHLTITDEMLSEFAKSLIDPQYPWKHSEKLIPNLLDKTKYVTHYNHRLILTKIHKVMTVKQEPWLRPWIYLKKTSNKRYLRQNDGKCSKSTKYSFDRRFTKSVESSFKRHVSSMWNYQQRPSVGQRRTTIDHIKQTNSRRIYNFGTVKIDNVQILLSSFEIEICRPLSHFVHQHRLTVLHYDIMFTRPWHHLCCCVKCHHCWALRSLHASLSSSCSLSISTLLNHIPVDCTML